MAREVVDPPPSFPPQALLTERREGEEHCRLLLTTREQEEQGRCRGRVEEEVERRGREAEERVRGEWAEDLGRLRRNFQVSEREFCTHNALPGKDGGSKKELDGRGGQQRETFGEDKAFLCQS